MLSIMYCTVHTMNDCMNMIPGFTLGIQISFSNMFSKLSLLLSHRNPRTEIVNARNVLHYHFFSTLKQFPSFNHMLQNYAKVHYHLPTFKLENLPQDIA